MLTRRMPLWPGIGDLRQEIDKLFDAFGGFAPPVASRTRAYPAVNVWEDGECLYLEAELPGVVLDDVKVEIQGDQLSIRGHREFSDSDNESFHRRERPTGEFSRFLTLPVEIHAAKVEATLKDGVLLLILPKDTTARARQITVKAN